MTSGTWRGPRVDGPLAIATDGKRAVTGGSDGKVRVWDLASVGVVGEYHLSDVGPVSSIALTPNNEHILVGAEDGVLRDIELASGRTNSSTDIKQNGPIRAIACTPDGTQAATGGKDGVLRLWNLAGHRPDAEFRSDEASDVSALAVAPDGRFLFVGSGDGSVRTWDIASGRRVTDSWTDHSGPVRSIVFARDGRRVITVGGRTANERNLAAKQEGISTYLGMLSEVQSASLTPDGKRLVILSSDLNDAAIQVVDLGTKYEAGLSWTGRNNFRTARAITPDGRTLVASSEQGRGLRTWRLDLQEPLAADRFALTETAAEIAPPPVFHLVGDPWVGHTKPVRSIALSSDGIRAVTGGDDGVHVWDIATGQQLSPSWGTNATGVTTVALTPDGRRLLTGGQEGVRIWDFASGQSLGQRWSSPTGDVWAVATSPDGSWAAIGTSGIVQVLDIEQGRPVGEPFEFPSVHSIAISPNGDAIVASGGSTGNGSIAFLKVNQSPMSLTADWVVSTTSVVWSVAFMPDGSEILAGSADGSVSVRFSSSGEESRGSWLCQFGEVWSVSTDGRRVFGASGGGRVGAVQAWDLMSGLPIGAAWVVATGALLAVEALPSVPRVVVCGVDGNVYLLSWDNHDFLDAAPRFAGVRSDAASTDDALGMKSDARTIASLLAAVETRPPLSIALMGNWGSGKSSFMALVQQQVRIYAETGRTRPNGAYVAHIKQISFNAWHYSDDHLWVGLIEHLFRELGRVDSGQAVFDLQQEHNIEAQLAESEAAQERLNTRLRQIDKLDPQIGWWGWLNNVRRSALVLRTVGEEAKNQWRRNLLIPVLLSVLAILVIVAATAANRTIVNWLGTFAGATIFAAAVRARVAGLVKTAQLYTKSAREKLLTDKSRYEENIAKLEAQLAEKNPSRKLDQLLVDISNPSRYSSDRGVVGRIHHDLRELSDQLARAQESDREVLQRIMLYIDDLDRCVPRRVVEVLQAVNLLLSMELFVVVVAVDPRWLLGALSEHHGELLNTFSVTTIDREEREGKREKSERPLDYLDKIFHVPFAIQLMNDHASSYFRTLLPGTTPGSQRKEAEEVQSSLKNDSAEQDAVVVSPRQTSDSSESQRSGSPDNSLSRATAESSDVPSLQSSESSYDVDVRSLYLSESEVDFLLRLVKLLPTPRALKKLANTYRLLRISIPDSKLRNFLGDAGTGGAYQACALLLAAIIGHPGQARSLLLSIQAANPEDDILMALGNEPEALAVKFCELIQSLKNEVPLKSLTYVYQRWATVVSRFSFDTYDLFTGSVLDVLELSGSPELGK